MSKKLWQSLLYVLCLIGKSNKIFDLTLYTKGKKPGGYRIND